MNWLQSLSSLGGSFIPHGHCYLWQSNLVWLHGVSDAVIALAYYLISLTLLYFVQQRQDIPFRGLFWLFAAFIAACGTTHVLAIWTLWFPTYWISGGVKAFTALISLWTALQLIPRIPQLLATPNALELETLNQSLSQQIAERQAAEAAVKQLNQELEQRVAQRTQVLEQSQQKNECLLQREQVIRSQLEDALENLHNFTERLNIALSAAQMGSWDWSLETQHLYWSPKTEEIMGFVPGTAKPSYAAWADRVHPEDRPKVETALADAQQNQQLFSEEYRLLWPDDTQRWVLSQGKAIASPQGKPVSLIGVVQDITARKQSEIALKNSEARFRAVFEQAAVGMARLSARGDWLQVNQTFCDLLGYTADELIGQSFQSVTAVEDVAQDAHYYEQLMNAELHSCQFEKRYLHKNGTPIWTMVTVSTERTEAGEVMAFIAVIEDIQQLKQARTDLQARATELEEMNAILALTTATLKNRNAELDQFAYVASHDLKAPLRAIANLSEWIEEDLEGQLPEANQHQLSLLRSRVHRMENLINGLLEYSRIGRRKDQVKAIDLHQFLKEIIDSLSPPPGFTISLPEHSSPLTTNPVALRQVFANLISNAIKHHDQDHGHIQITAQDRGDQLEFAVTDDGPGIAPEYHEKVFTIFQTLKARDEVESTGIGLSIVKKIVESAGGTIHIESDLGQGTTFRFTW